MRRVVGLIVAVVAVVVAIGGCVTPSIPIPPPDPTKMTFHVSAGSGSDGTATFSYPAEPRYEDSTVYVFNENLGVGVIEDAQPDGSFAETPPFPAMLGNEVLVTVQRPDQTESTCIVLQDGTQDPNNLCE